MWANKNSGFTIVETLIVLAVSSALFISVVILVSGQVEKNRSKDAALRLQTIAQSIASDVSNGYYPENGTTPNCSDNFPNAPIVSAAGGLSRATNLECVFAGKKVTFSTDEIKIETLVTNSRVKKFDEAKYSIVPGLTETKTTPWQTKATTDKSYYFLYSRYKINESTNKEYVSGAQSVLFYVDDGAGNPIKPSAQSFVCFDNGNYKTSLVFPTDGSKTINLNIDDQTNC